MTEGPTSGSGVPVRLRRALPADAAAVAEVHVRAWQRGYRGLVPDDHLGALRAEDRAARYRFDDDDPDTPHTMIAVEGDAVLGFATVSARPDADGAGELLALYVDPARWGEGVGRRLLREARRRLGGEGCSAATLWVLAGNERAERFYRRDGWRDDGRRRRVEVWGIDVDEVGYRRTVP